MRQKSGPESTGRAGREGHSASDAPAILGRRKDPHRTGRRARGGEHRRAVSARGNRLVDVLRLVERVPRCRQAPAGRDTTRAATSDEVKDLRREAQALKEAVADLTLENRLLKKSMLADGEDEA
jgi:hypothetical protein